MKVQTTRLPGVLVLASPVFGDHRGQFRETWREADYAAAGLPTRFVQDNASLSRRGVLRGLHLQHPNGQGKLISVLSGAVYDVAVDARVGSPTFGQWTAALLSAENGWQMFIPSGLAHGFVATADATVVSYKCTEYYHAASDLTIAWNDPDLAIDWPVDDPVLSTKDQCAPRWRDIPADRLPRFAP